MTQPSYPSPHPQQPPPQVIIVQQPQRSSGCLITALAYLLFGWLGLLFVAIGAAVRLMWRWFVVAPIVGSVRFSRWLTRSYGWRGWLVFGAILVALTILGAIVGPPQ